MDDSDGGGWEGAENERVPRVWEDRASLAQILDKFMFYSFKALSTSTISLPNSQYFLCI